MAKFEMRGIEKYLNQLRALEKGTNAVCKAAVYAGAKVLADGIKEEILSLDRVTDAEAKAAWRAKEPVKISVSQKIGLAKSLGVTPIKDTYGFFNAKIGFDGYNDVKTDRWPQGQPNDLIARTCESGSTAMLKQPFIRPTEKRLREQVERAMEEAADKEMQKVLEGS